MNVTDYYIVFDDSCDGLENGVKEKLQEGWQPLGGIAIDSDEQGGEYYYQAMVKYQVYSVDWPFVMSTQQLESAN